MYEGGSSDEESTEGNTHRAMLEPETEGYLHTEEREVRTSDLELNPSFATSENPFSVTDKSFESEPDMDLLFRTFSEPEISKTGYLIPLTCGHNGVYSEEEKTLLDIHLASAGFISNEIS